MRMEIENAIMQMKSENLGFLYLGWCRSVDFDVSGIPYGCEHAYAITRPTAHALLRHTSSCAGGLTSQLHKIFNRGLIKYGAVEGIETNDLNIFLTLTTSSNFFSIPFYFVITTTVSQTTIVSQKQKGIRVSLFTYRRLQ